ncbi:unnamed protein product, partial [Didymodactylos carnosus]
AINLDNESFSEEKSTVLVPKSKILPEDKSVVKDVEVNLSTIVADVVKSMNTNVEMVSEKSSIPQIPIAQSVTEIKQQPSSILMNSTIRNDEQLDLLMKTSLTEQQQPSLIPLSKRVGSASHIPHRMDDDLDITTIINKSKNQTMSLMSSISPNNTYSLVGTANNVLDLIREEKTKKVTYVNPHNNDITELIKNQQNQTNLVEHAENERKEFLNAINTINYYY